jgi:asparagine synthase (glutamine-hydrolysing)
MCGIVGIAGWASVGADLGPQVERMAGALVHRGPDDQGVWLDQAEGIGLGQRRLSIVDLSPQGHQPMVSSSGRFVLSFNGEIYNHKTLRIELESAGLAPAWKGHSDTEVLLACLEAWGMEATLRRTVGMFAISLWDRAQRTLSLARDRMGEKPLYYGRVGSRVLLASELKALRTVAAKDLAVDRDALVQYMRFGYIPAPTSIYRGIHKLPPGHWLQMRCTADADSAPVPYWSMSSSDTGSLRRELASAGDTAIVSIVEQRLLESIRLQMMSDVPVGAFLSGGIDSSLVVSLMQAQSSMKVRTFTIGFDQREFDEAPYARAVASHLGTDHTELYVSARDAEAIVPRLPAIYDEPFADSSQIPTTLVSHLTRQHVTVSLSGDGGDELFAGYPRYGLTERLWNRVNRIPQVVRSGAAMAASSLSPRTWDRVISRVPGVDLAMVNGRRVHRMAQMIQARHLGDMYLLLMSHWQPSEQLVLGAQCSAELATSESLRHWNRQKSPLDAMRAWDLGQYLPDDLLVKVDRASMSASLEARAPLLDHRVVELALALPARALVRDGTGKWALRQVLHQHVPAAMFDRPKAGFSVPLAQWLRGPLRDWAEALLEPGQLAADGMLAPEKVRRVWCEHQTGTADRSTMLWTVLMFRSWQAAVASDA